MTDPHVEFQDVHRSFGGGLHVGSLARLKVRRKPRRQVLRDVSFALGRGEWFAIMGSNGSGKTTILKMVAGLVRPESGTVRLAGVDVRDDPAAVRRAVGYSLADERSFQWRLTARENLRFFAALEGLRGAPARRRVDRLLEALDLSAQAERPFGEFSTGIRQRLAIARALLAQPEVLLLDEPTRSLDANHAEEAWAVIQDEVSGRGGSVLLATHRPEEAAAHCDQVWLLKDGVLRRDTSVRYQRPASAGLVIVARGVAPAGMEALRAVPGIVSVEPVSIRAGEQVLEVRADGREASLAGLLRMLARHGGAIEAVQEQVVLSADVAAVERQAV